MDRLIKVNLFSSSTFVVNLGKLASYLNSGEPGQRERNGLLKRQSPPRAEQRGKLREQGQEREV